MSWTTPPVFTVGEVLTAALQNTLSADLTVLQTAIGSYGVGSALVGGPPPAAGTPNLYFQGGDVTGATLSAGEYTLVYPTAFPTGVLTAWVVPVNSAEQSVTLRTSAAGSSASQLNMNFWTGSVASTGTAIFTWGAIGF